MYFDYGIPRAFRHLISDWRPALNNILILTASLSLSGMVALLYLNVMTVSEAWLSNTTVSLFLRKGLSTHQRTLLVEKVRRHPMVNNVTLVPPEEGLEILAERLGADRALIRSAEKDALPYTIDFQVFLHYRDKMASIAKSFEAWSGVQDVVYAERVVDKVALFFNIVRGVGWFFITLIVVSFCLIIANATRLSLQARRQEIEILHFSGAPRPFIRSAFIVEGLLLALAGWLAALAVIRVSFMLTVAGLTWNAATMPLKELAVFFPWEMLASSLGVGMALGAFSSYFSVNGLLKKLEP